MGVVPTGFQHYTVKEPKDPMDFQQEMARQFQQAQEEMARQLQLKLMGDFPPRGEISIIEPFVPEPPPSLLIEAPKLQPKPQEDLLAFHELLDMCSGDE